MLLWVNLTAYAFFCLRTMVPPKFPKKAEVPWVPKSFEVGASGSPTACHEYFGDDGVSENFSYLKMTSVIPDFRGFANSAVLGLVDEALTVSPGMSRRTSGSNGVSVPQVVARASVEKYHFRVRLLLRSIRNSSPPPVVFCYERRSQRPLLKHRGESRGLYRSRD